MSKFVRPAEKVEPTKAISLCIQGNIGSGKSTLLKGFQKLGLETLPEPVDVWGAHIPKLYTAPERWAFTFEMECLDWFRKIEDKLIVKDLEYPLKIVERDGKTAISCFGATHLES